MSYLAVTKNIKEAALKTSGSELVYIFFFWDNSCGIVVYQKSTSRNIGIIMFQDTIVQKKAAVCFR